MHPPPALERAYHGFTRRALIACLAIILGLTSDGLAADSARRNYDLPAAPAAQSLKTFSEQSGKGLLVSTETARGIRTNAVKGEFTANEALAKMLAGTGLVAAQDEKNGAFVVKKEARDPNEFRAAPVTTGDRPASNDDKLTGDTVLMTPFEVSSAGDRGYYGANTMSGTRLNSKLEDLATSITVITKEQMDDFALLDINDIFNYEAGTEGTGNFTDFEFDRNGVATDNTELNPGNANRIRGIGPANITSGSFETSGRTPIDPIDIDAVEISRGPNSSLFGIGNAAGTVNTVRTSANVSRNQSRLSLRADSNEGYRSSIDLNRVLKKDVLAIRGSAVFQHDGFALKPSGTDSERYNAMVKFRPFKLTSLTASYSTYHLYGNRPNTSTPRDGIARWRESGSPTWDPVTNTATTNGVRTTGLPPALSRIDRTYTNMFLDHSGVYHWSFGQSTNTATPISQNGARMLVVPHFDPTRTLNRTEQPLIQSYFPPLTSKEIYDWSELNISAPNWVEDKSAISSVLLEQFFISTPRHSLAAQLGWFRESSERYSRNMFAPNTGISTAISIDMNERWLDGTPNPNFMRPYLNAANPRSSFAPLDRNTYRVQLAYKLDPGREKTWQRWLGSHHVSAYGEYKEIQSRNRSYVTAIVNDQSWIPAGVTRGTSNAAGGLPAGPRTAQVHFYSYVGDNQGQNLDYVPTGIPQGVFPLTWGNAQTGVFVQEPAELGSAYFSGGGGSNNWTILKSRGAILQSHFLKDRIVTTFGWRHDARYSRGGGPIRLLPDGIALDEASFHSWSTNNWNVGKGPTQTRGVVVKPLRWLSLFVNQSDSFQPANPALNLYRERLPDPAGKGEDYGIMLRLFDGKLFVRANAYTTEQLGSRNGDNATLGRRMLQVDRSNVPGVSTAAPAYQLQRNATEWVTAAAEARGQVLTNDQLETEVAKIMGLPVEALQPLPFGSATTSDITAKGTEVEINYNPTAHWTMKLNLTEQKTIDSNLAPDVTQWLAERMKVWPNIIDPLTGRPWYTERYNNQMSAAEYVAFNVTAPLGLAIAGNGLSRPQIRKYRANFMTNFRLAGISDNPILKRFNVGGSVRWEDKGAIGYWGLQQLPDMITDYDRSRPIYDSDHLYVDILAGYRTRFFKDKIGATFQLNIRNVTEDGRLQAIGANPDGTIRGYRIISPRVFILSATFDL
ncbi:MAG: TonB-dependent receptor plug domain-containing protein [Opitutaceae bacterium]|nr:TonB-dependent receptor plug domain-containing protein [Opitutaceae bacterium]